MALPREPGPLVGRDHDIDEVRHLLRRTRLLTLAGSGGSGKTRLALRVAQEADRVWWVDLAAASDPAQVETRVARGIGVTDAPGRELRPAIAEQLAAGPTLVVLDNCEHLLDACAEFTQWALSAVAALRLLVTSRQPLGITGETTWPVPPLAIPAAAELFRQRACADNPGYSPDDREAEAVAELCRRLDGLPLAIELAAARARVLSAGQILDRLAVDPALLAVSTRDLPARHRTLMSTMDWSHGLLTPGEQRVFRWLSVFPGSFDLDAVEHVTGEPVLERLSALADKSLVVVEPRLAAGSARYRLLETVRRYGQAKLDEAGEADRAQVALVDWVIELAGSAARGLAGVDQRRWIERLDADHDTIVAALDGLARTDDVARGLRLVGLLGRYWWYAGRFAEGARWIRCFLDRPAASDHPAARADALHALGLACFWHESAQAGIDNARQRFEQAAVLYRQLGDDAGLAATLRDLGCYWKGYGEFDRARAVLGECIALGEAVGDAAVVAGAASYLGIVAAYQGDSSNARVLLERCLAVLPIEHGSDEASRSMYFLACLDCDAGDVVSARSRLEILLALESVQSLPYTAGFAIDGLARLAVAEGEPTRALRLAGAAQSAHRSLGTSAGPAYDEFIHSGLKPAVARLGPAAADRARADGAQLSAMDALVEGLTPSTRGRDALSGRECEVLRLAAIGLADGEIANRLHLSRRTVGNHLGSIYRKLAVANRTAAVHTARERGILQP
jgi:non-specific serine/threonine protein kinase